jgi:hypothetical protein
VAERYHGRWTTREIADHLGCPVRDVSRALRQLGVEPVGRARGPSHPYLWDAQDAFDRLATRPGTGDNLRKAGKWPHPDGWRCGCHECRGRKQRQRDELTARYLAERIRVDDHWEAPVPPEKHGLLATATKRGCECQPCRDRAARHWRDKPRRPRKRCVYPGCERQGRMAWTLCKRHHRLTV